MDAANVFSVRPEHACCNFDNFETNLKNLKESVAKDIIRMQKDCEMFGHDLQPLLEVRADDVPSVSWHRSKARVTLKADMKSGLHNTLLPHEMFEKDDRPECREFTLTQFRKSKCATEDKKEKQAFRIEKKGCR